MKRASLGVSAATFLALLSAHLVATSWERQEVGTSDAVTVTFADGSTQTVDHLRFVYVWTQGGRGVNFRESADFHYVDTIRGVSVDKTIARTTLKRFDVSWLRIGENWRSAATLTLADGTRLSLHWEQLLDAPRTFLLGKKPEEISASDRTSLLRIEIHGVATVAGQRGNFLADLSTYDERGPSHRVASILFGPTQ